MEQSGVEFSDMMSSVTVEDKTIVASVTAGKESGVSCVISSMYEYLLSSCIASWDSWQNRTRDYWKYKTEDKKV